MQSSKPVPANQLAATFGSKAAACLEQQGSQVSYVPQRTVLQISCPVNFVSYVEKTNLLPVTTQTQYRQVSMAPQQQVQNSPCPQNLPAAAPMIPIRQEEGCEGSCGSGSCRQGPYHPSPPMAMNQVPYAAQSPCGAQGPYGSQVPYAAPYEGYEGAMPGGSQMVYAPPPQGVASYQAGMYPMGASYAASSY
jgi:hypothetical protein